ncbi:MAG: hypothetical protein AAGH99_10355 [Planctomycetota bacterium]
MDELDTNLLLAWEEVRAKLAADPAARARRYERGLRSALRRPVRAWCVSVKASDTRIEHGAMEDGEAAEACRERERHRVVLFGELVRHLVRPVEIDLPGLRYDVAAGRLGIDLRTIVDWMDKGWVESRREKVPGRRGLPTRFVFTRRGGIDVCFPQGRDARWGTLWRGLWDRVPTGFEQTVERVPRLRPGACGGVDSGEEGWRDFYGWDWVCPGRVLADGTEAGCGRVCKKLVAPLPVWTIGRAISSDLPEVPIADYEPERVRFACARCWNVQHMPSDLNTAWNQLVTAISGGLLYGREVERPRGIIDS